MLKGYDGLKSIFVSPYYFIYLFILFYFCCPKTTITYDNPFNFSAEFKNKSIFFLCQAAICRCSQPLAGFSARCVEDEQMLNAILRANPESSFMYVVDTRPKVRSKVNHLFGALSQAKPSLVLQISLRHMCMFTDSSRITNSFNTFTCTQMLSSLKVSY